MMKKFITAIVCGSFLCAAPHAWADNPVKVLFAEAMQAYGTHDYPRAIALLEKISQIYPNFAPTYNYLGLCYKDSGSKPEEIAWLFEKATQLDPNYADPYDNLAKLYYSTTDFDKAEENGLKAVQINPDFPTAHLTLGWIYLLGKSQPQDAINHFDKVVGANADVPYAQFGLGMAYHMLHENFRVLDAVTNLRKSGREDLAQQLEQVIRAGNYKSELIPGMPMIAQPKQTQQMKEENLTFSDDNEVKKTPVRLSSTPPSVSDGENTVAAESPQDRLRALRRRGMQGQGH